MYGSVDRSEWSEHRIICARAVGSFAEVRGQFVLELQQSTNLDKELKDLDLHNSLNFFATGITLGFNILISFTLVVYSVYIHCKHIKVLLQKCVPTPFSTWLFGEFDQESFWKSTYKDEQERSDDDNRRHTVWVACFMMLAPLFFAAWLMEPSKTTSVACIPVHHLLTAGKMVLQLVLTVPSLLASAEMYVQLHLSVSLCEDFVHAIATSTQTPDKLRSSLEFQSLQPLSTNSC